jgi:hypothetical protein
MQCTSVARSIIFVAPKGRTSALLPDRQIHSIPPYRRRIHLIAPSAFETTTLENDAQWRVNLKQAMVLNVVFVVKRIEARPALDVKPAEYGRNNKSHLL